MGANASTAMSNNIANISQNTNVSSQQSCNNSQIITVGQETVQVGNVSCKNLNIGNVTAVANQTCNQYQDVSVTSKVVADQLAQSLAKTGIGVFNSAVAYASNYIDVQNNLNTIISSSCINSQDISIADRILTAGNVSGEQCNIFDDGFTQQAACIQTIKADITNSSDISQTAEATAIAGLDLGELIALLIAICVIIVLFMLSAIVLKSLLKPSVPRAAKGAGKVSISSLIQTRNALKNQLAARTAAIARRAAK
jgi:hypothetical protein